MFGKSITLFKLLGFEVRIMPVDNYRPTDHLSLAQGSSLV